jgi:SM-20-related protein
MGISEALSAAGISVADGYLDLARVRALHDCLCERRNRGDFRAARIGRGKTLQQNLNVRGDEICWLEEPLLTAERELLLDLEQLRLQLNRELYLGLFELELHYAWYPPGRGYARHVDQSSGSSARRLSLILYLNEGWPSEAGGELELYDAQGGCRRIEPLAGRLVCFLTEGREHAVLAAHQDRFSVTGWFRGRETADGGGPYDGGFAASRSRRRQ